MGGGPGASKYGVVSHSMCAAAFLALTLFSLWRIMEPLAKVQSHDLRFRVYWCVKCSIYVCVMSFWVSVLHVTNFETIVWAEMGMSTDNIIKPLEYIITCPAMMLIIVVLAGDKVPPRRQMEVMGLTTCVLLVGFAAVQTPAIPAKMMFYGTGVTFFITLMHRVNLCVKQHSDGKECLFSGGPLAGSIYRKLCFKTAATWVLFPVWFLLSPEGLGFIKDKDSAVLITAVLNIFSKAFFILYVVHIYEDFVSEESLMHHSHGKHTTHQEQQAAEAAARLGPAQAIQAMQSNIRASQECIAKIQSMMDKDQAKKAEADKFHADRMHQNGVHVVSGPSTPLEYTGYGNTMGGFQQPASAPMSHRSGVGGSAALGGFAAAGPPISTQLAPPVYTQQTQVYHGAAPPGMPLGATLGGVHQQAPQVDGQAYPGIQQSFGEPGMSMMPPESQPPLAQQPQHQLHSPHMQQPPIPMPDPQQPPSAPQLLWDTAGTHDGHHKLQTTADHGCSMPMALGAAAPDDKMGDADFPMYPEVVPAMQAPLSNVAPASGGGIMGGSMWGALRSRRGAALEVDSTKQVAEQELDP